QEAFLLEERHRLPDGRAAHAERLRKLALVEPNLLAMGVDISVHDRLLQGRIGLFAQAHIGVEGLELELGWSRLARFDGGVRHFEALAQRDALLDAFLRLDSGDRLLHAASRLAHCSVLIAASWRAR